MNKLTPIVGCWYRELQQGITFEVVAYDEADHSIETQLLDGAVTEYDVESWRQMLIEEIEDWRNAYEMSNEDYLDPDAAIHPEDWCNPVNLIESDIVNGVLDDL